MSISTIASVFNYKKQSKENKAAAQQASQQQAAAVASLKQEQAQAGVNAAEAVKRRSNAATQTIYTSPLGISEQATTAKKRLLGQ